MPAAAPLAAVDVADPGHREEQDAPRYEGLADVPQRRFEVVDQVQRLGQHDAVERLVGQGPVIGEIADDGRPRRVGVDVEHVGVRHAGAAEPSRVGVVAHLEHAAADVGGMGGEERLDVVAVDGSAAPVAEVAGDRRRAA